MIASRGSRLRSAISANPLSAARASDSEATVGVGAFERLGRGGGLLPDPTSTRGDNRAHDDHHQQCHCARDQVAQHVTICACVRRPGWSRSVIGGCGGAGLRRGLRLTGPMQHDELRKQPHQQQPYHQYRGPDHHHAPCRSTPTATEPVGQTTGAGGRLTGIAEPGNERHGDDHQRHAEQGRDVDQRRPTARWTLARRTLNARKISAQ